MKTLHFCRWCKVAFQPDDFLFGKDGMELHIAAHNFFYEFVCSLHIPETVALLSRALRGLLRWKASMRTDEH